MPRAFLITRRRYDGTEEFQTAARDYSPEGRAGSAEYVGAGGHRPSSDGASDCASESSSECPEELYNLTKLAEVSLAAAAGTLIRPRTVLSYDEDGRSSPRWDTRVVRALRTVVLPAGGESRHRDAIEPDEDAIGLSLRERTRLFFERIGTERESLQTGNDNILGIGAIAGGDVVSSLDTEICNVERGAGGGCGGGGCGGGSGGGSSSEGSKSDDSEDHECPDCGKKYSTSSNLARHRQTHRSLGDKKARRCPHCDKIYVSMPAFSMHVRTHNQGCKCHYCGKCFSRPWLLQGHIRTHTGEKPFKCTICNKAFADKSNLRAHVQTHSNTKPHVCGRCGKAFALKSYLYKHEESSCMRAHLHRSASERTNEPSCPSPTSPPPFVATASPTSVIVQCSSGGGAIARQPIESTSGIIRHTKNVHAPGQVQESSKISQIVKPTELVSRRMLAIRSSVISTNPESRRFLGRLDVASSSADLANSPPPSPPSPPLRPLDFADSGTTTTPAARRAIAQFSAP